MDVFEAIFFRRSIRKFIDKPVEEEKIARILDAARWAPSIGNLQECEFIIVDDLGKKIQLSEAALGQYWISQASVVIVVLTKNDRVSRLYGKKADDFVKYDAAAAIQNMLLAAHALGLGACWVSVFEEEAVERILNIPSELDVHALIPIGYPAEKPNPPHRRGIEFITYFNEYGNRWIKLKEKQTFPA
ncbi:MAG: nitroreductase family protein [Nanoarchaeota archaeon]|nr:nitroreductase family protein [Nanoarchaeota archaeon]